MNEEFEIAFSKFCWNMHIDETSTYADTYRRFAEKFYELGLEHGQKQNI